jgi:hypothetical protein
MPTSTKIEKYPEQFQRLAERFEYDRSQIEIPCTSGKAAMALRFKLYGFKRAIDHANASAPAGARLWPQFSATEIIIRGAPPLGGAGGAVVVIRMPEDDAALAGLDAALGAVQHDVATVEELLSRPLDDIPDAMEDAVEAYLGGSPSGRGPKQGT